MTIKEYIGSRGLTVRLVSQKMGVTRQALCQYSNDRFTPTTKTLERISKAMTELGAPTTVVDLVAAIFKKEA